MEMVLLMLLKWGALVVFSEHINTLIYLSWHALPSFNDIVRVYTMPLMPNAAVRILTPRFSSSHAAIPSKANPHSTAHRIYAVLLCTLIYNENPKWLHNEARASNKVISKITNHILFVKKKCYILRLRKITGILSDCILLLRKFK